MTPYNEIDYQRTKIAVVRPVKEMTLYTREAEELDHAWRR